jgi:hypothetical protein
MPEIASGHPGNVAIGGGTDFSEKQQLEFSQAPPLLLNFKVKSKQ